MKKLLITEEQYKRIFLKDVPHLHKGAEMVIEQKKMPYKIQPLPILNDLNTPLSDIDLWDLDQKNIPDLNSMEGYPDNWKSMTPKEKNDWILGLDLIPQVPVNDKGVPILKKKVDGNPYHWNKHIGAYVHPAYWDYPEVPAQFVELPKNKRGESEGKENEELFKNNLQDQIDGNAFRKWIYKQPALLKRINKILKEKYGEGLDKSSKYYNNKYIKAAFDAPFQVMGYDVFVTNAGEIYSTVGEMWIKKEGNKNTRKSKIEAQRAMEKTRKEQKDSFNYYTNHPLYKNVDYSRWGDLENVKKSWHWDNYVEALSNWNKVNKFFGWTDDRSVSSDHTLNILQRKVPASTCIDPTHLFNRYIELFNEIYKIEGTADILMSVNLKFDDINNYFGDVEKPPKLQTNMDDEDDDEDKEDNSYGVKDGAKDILKVMTTGAIGPFLDIASEPASSTYVDKKKLSLMDMLPAESDEIINQRQRYKIQNQLIEKLKKVGSDDLPRVKELLALMNKYTALLEMVDIHNIIIYGQSKTMYEQACDDCDDCKTHYGNKGEDDRPDLVYTTTTRTYTHHEDGEIKSTIHHTFSRKDMCKKNGGIFLLPAQSKKEIPAGHSYGFTTDQAFCCCVNPVGTANVTIYKGGENPYTADIDIAEFCNKSGGDIRSWSEKVGQWGYDCVHDWHCVADILSIAAYAFGPWGAVASAIIDLVSAAGYAIEGEEGWKMNAGLTALGAFGGIYEAVSLAGKGVKFGSKLGGLGKILDSGVDFLKIEDDIAQWAKTLSKSEKEQYEAFVTLSKKLNTAEGVAIHKKMVSEMDKLSKVEKGVLAKLLRDKNTDEIIDLYNKSGKNMEKMVRTAYKGTTQATIQATLFGGVHVFSTEIGEGLKKIHDKWGFDPLGIFDDQGQVSVFNPLEGVNWDRVVKDSPEYIESVNKLKDSFVKPTPELKTLDQLYSSYYISYKHVIEHFEKFSKKDKLDKLRELNEVARLAVDDKGLDLSYIKKQLSIATDIYNKCGQEKAKGMKIHNSNNDDIGLMYKQHPCDALTIKGIDEAIKTIKNNEKEKISEEEKYAIVATGMDVSKEDSDAFADLLQQAIEQQTMEKENIEEEIKRIKSLFTEERLYGNLINEQYAYR